MPETSNVPSLDQLEVLVRGFELAHSAHKAALAEAMAIGLRRYIDFHQRLTREALVMITAEQIVHDYAAGSVATFIDRLDAADIHDAHEMDDS